MFAKCLVCNALMLFVCNIQLRDPSLRRHILLQFLIVIQLLTKGKRELLGGSSAIIVTPTMHNELETLKARVLACIAQTPPDGVRFKEAIVHILSREQYWMRWKESGCVAVEKPALEPITIKPRPATALKLPKSGLPVHWTSVGSTVDYLGELAAAAQGMCELLLW